MVDCVVLLHGWPGTRRDFRRVEGALAEGPPLYVPDLLGFADAFDGPVELAEATAEAHAARVIAALDRQGHDRVVLA
ncbi:MAG TPA: alpha/beta fold hydrolase, partial [Capillimicrobium sp.]